MYGVLVSATWPQYYASSPFLNLLNLKHPRFEVIPMSSDIFTDHKKTHEFHSRIAKFDGLVIDDVWINAVIDNSIVEVPVLMIDGDPHRHRPDQVPGLENKYRKADYVLTGGVFAKKHPRYFYPTDDLRKEKFVYYPHSAPGGAPPPAPWHNRHGGLLVSGSTDKIVYPYRHAIAAVPYAFTLPFQQFNHEAYFNKVSQYKLAATCQSVLEYTVAKYFEIPWCGTCLVAQPMVCGEADILGFVSEVNCLLIEAWQGNYLFQNDEQYKDYERIAKAGHELIMKRHTIDSRGDYLATLLDQIIAGPFQPEDAFGIFQNIPERKI